MLKTTRAEVDNLDFRMQRMGQEDVLRLEIAMYYFVLLQEDQAAQKLFGESSNDLQRKASEGVGFNELVKVHIQKFRGYAKVSSEVEALCEIDHAVLVVGVLVRIR
jgi:hypothetical protein